MVSILHRLAVMRSHDNDFEAGLKGTLRRMLAEAFGTFALTFVDAGGAMIAALSDQVTPPARAAAVGLVILAMVYALSNVSGAHLNPAVTWGFALRGAFAWRHVRHYWLAQLVGAALAIVLLRGILGDVAHLGATVPERGAGAALVMEIVLTTFLVTVILSTATRHRVLGPIAAHAAGGTVALCALFARPVSGASMNPARSLAPALIGWVFGQGPAGAWVYLVGPFAGATIAVILTALLHPKRHRQERDAAEGESHHEER